MTISNNGEHSYLKEMDLAHVTHILLDKKQHYIRRAKERLPHYYSPDKQLQLQQMTMDDIYKNGLPKEILWKMVEYNISAKHGMSTQHLCKIGEHINYLASQYVTYEARIHRDFSNEERAQQLTALNETFQRSFERMASVFVEAVGDFFERNEVADERQLLIESIEQLYERKIQLYRSYIQQHPDFAEIEGTEDAWLLRDSYFMGDILRVLVEHKEIKMPSSLYSECELVAMGAFYQSARKWLIMQKSTAVSEEQLGVELGIFGMKTVVLQQQQNLSTLLRQKLKTVFHSFYAYKVNDLDKRQREEAQNMYTTDKRLYGPIDRDAVQKWTDEMVAYAKQGNVHAAFTSLMQEAFEYFDEKVRNGSLLERYQDSNEWYRFMQSEELVSSQTDAFTWQLRTEDWNQFLQSIEADRRWYFKLNA